MSSDEVMDYLIMEAVASRIAKEDEQAEKAAERERWKAKTDDLRQRVGT
jgi:hypothetical protein